MSHWSVEQKFSHIIKDKLVLFVGKLIEDIMCRKQLYLPISSSTAYYYYFLYIIKIRNTFFAVEKVIVYTIYFTQCCLCNRFRDDDALQIA